MEPASSPRLSDNSTTIESARPAENHRSPRRGLRRLAVLLAGAAMLVGMGGCQNPLDWMKPTASQPTAPGPASSSAPSPAAAIEATIEPIPPEQVAARTPVGRRPPAALPAPVRAIWVARFHYRYEDDVRIIIRNCAELGANTVLWQVRGEGTVQYPSTFEPWSEEFRYKDPGFDPLRVAVEEAHRHGLRLEPWINVMPGWKGPKEPWIPEQLWKTRRDWFLMNAKGERAPLGDFYALLNPAFPEVRRHIVGIVSEIAGRYDVDGIHLDYIRYAWDVEPNAKNLYPRDARTLELYRRETGLRPDDKPEAWDEWRANQLTRLVGEIRLELNRVRPGAALTAAVRSDPYLARSAFLQNSITWLRNRFVDAVYPMAYTEDIAVFQRDVQSYRRLAAGAPVIPGLGIYKHLRPEPMRQQLADCLRSGGGFALYSYESLFPTAGDRNGGLTAAEQRQRQMRREVLAEFVRVRRGDG